MNFSAWGKAAVARVKFLWGYGNPLGLEPDFWNALRACADCKSFKERVECFLHLPKYKGKKLCGPLPSESEGQGAPPAAGKTAGRSPVVKKRVPFSKLPRYCFLSRSAALIDGYLSYPAGEEGRLGLVRIGFHGGGDPAGVDGVEIELDSICELRICISHANSKIKIGEEVWGKWVLRLFRDASVEIGNKVTCNKADVIIDNGELKVGDDCMFADIFIHAGDNHALFDVQSGEALNVRRAKVHIGPHVWIASRATILGDATIGAGSVVAANATVKGDVPSCALVAGIPARAIKIGVSWTRSANGDGWQDVVRQLSGLGDGQGG